MTPIQRRIALGAAAAVTLAAVVVALRPEPTPVDLAVATRGPLQVTIDEEGRTRARHRFVVSSPVAGRVLRIAIEPGDPVIADATVLATFLPAPPTPLDARARAELAAEQQAARSTLGQAEADLARVREELGLAQREAERMEQLARSQVVASDRLDIAEVEHRRLQRAEVAARHGVGAARHRLEAVTARLSRGVPHPGDDAAPILIRSPIDGVVLKRLRESEAVVPAGEPLLEIADPQDLEIVADLLSSLAVQVRPDQRVVVERWGGDRELTGRVRRVEPSGFLKVSALGVEEQRVNVLIDLDDPPRTGDVLGDGYRVEVRIVVWEEVDVLAIPTSSLFRHRGDWAVFTVVDGAARRTPLELGRRNSTEAQVVAGVTAGTAVIIHPSDSVTDGAQISPRQTDNAGRS